MMCCMLFLNRLEKSDKTWWLVSLSDRLKPRTGQSLKHFTIKPKKLHLQIMNQTDGGALQWTEGSHRLDSWLQVCVCGSQVTWRCGRRKRVCDGIVLGGSGLRRSRMWSDDMIWQHVMSPACPECLFLRQQTEKEWTAGYCTSVTVKHTDGLLICSVGWWLITRNT